MRSLCPYRCVRLALTGAWKQEHEKSVKKFRIIVCYVEIWSIILTMKTFVYSVFLKNSVLHLKGQILDLGNWFYKFMVHQFI